MSVNYDDFSQTFSRSRKNMKWEELGYFFSLLSQGSILDIGAGSGRLLLQYKEYFGSLPSDYLGVDLSKLLIEEAITSFSKQEFLIGNMLDIKSIVGKKTFQNIFLIASFHHLETREERISMMQDLYDITSVGGAIYMTNWALTSQLHKTKYASSEVKGTTNLEGGSDFSIKIGSHQRFYHNFSLEELEKIVAETSFSIKENRLFHNDKNYITILQK